MRCRELTFHNTAEEICRRVMFYLSFFHYQKRDMTSSVTSSERVKYYSSFLKYTFTLNWQVFVFFSTNLYTVLPLSNYYSILKAEANET